MARDADGRGTPARVEDDEHDEHDERDEGDERDVLIVGGGPAGCSAAVFTARYGLDTAVFDRGNASLRRCAHLENYLGFPAGIDVETFYALAHDQVREAGAGVIADTVTSVDWADDESRFLVETQEGRTFLARRVVAASTYDGEYLRGLDDDAAMFETHDHHGQTHGHFSRDYPDADGRTPVDGLYVAGGLAGHGAQAIVAAGHGASVARSRSSITPSAPWRAASRRYRSRSTSGGATPDRSRFRGWRT